MRRTPAGMEIDEMKRIVVDSSASLYALDGVDFAAVPLKIVTDEREYLDDGTLDAVEMATPPCAPIRARPAPPAPTSATGWRLMRAQMKFMPSPSPAPCRAAATPPSWPQRSIRQSTRVLRSLCWTACLPARNWCCWPSISVRSSKRVRILTRSAKRCCATVTTPICCSRWNRWRIWPGMAG